MNKMSRQHLRRCLINGNENGYFHCWEQMSEIIPPSLMRGGHPGGTVSGCFAIVETDDGIVHRVKPENLAFLDAEKTIQITNDSDGGYRRCQYTDFLGRVEGEGTFHCWGSSAYRSHDGVVAYTVAIIEKDDGTVIQALPRNVIFIDEDKSRT